jgi:hypothetical protein
MSSSEPDTAVMWTAPSDAGAVEYFSTANLKPEPVQMADSAKPTAYSKPVDGWALSPSGFRVHFSLWFGRGILGTGGSTCSFGGEFRRG